MSAKAQKPDDLTIIDNQNHYFEYFYYSSFFSLMSDITKDYLWARHSKPKNRKEALIAYWIVLKLRYFIQSTMPNQNIIISVKERVIGLLDSTNYDIVIYYNHIPIIVVDIYYFMSNVSRNFNRIFKDIVFNANNINNHDGLEYIPFLVINEESPVFVTDDNKDFEKMEEFSLSQLAKLYNLSICGHNKIDIPTLLLTPYIDAEWGKRSGLKVRSPKYSTWELFFKEALKEGYAPDDVNVINKKMLIPSIEMLLKIILSKIAMRMKRSNY